MPNIGLITWTVLSFGILVFILAKFAWKPIMKGIHDREDSIEKSLQVAEQAHKDMLKLKAGNEELLKQAKEERDELLNSARKLKENILEDARQQGTVEANRIVQAAMQNIEMEKQAALNELKAQIAEISIEIAEKILQQELSKENKQKEVVEKLISQININ